MPYKLHPAKKTLSRLFDDRPLPTGDHEKPRLLPFGDREVIGFANEDGMQFWFFNPDFSTSLPDAEPFLAMEESG